RIIGDAAEYDHPPDYTSFFQARREEHAKLGLSVLEITNELRRSYALSAFDVVDDTEDTLRSALADVERERLENIKAQAEWNERMVARIAEREAALEITGRGVVDDKETEPHSPVQK
ncbi:hypothetical protein ABUE31_22605, partial [Mesorhizobium sp. ZMM04-5]